MSDKQFTLVVILEAKPGKETALKEILTSLIAPTRKEEGCIEYRLNIAQDSTNKFMFYETWASAEAHALHGKTAHMAKWHAVKADLLASVTKHTWEEVLTVDAG